MATVGETIVRYWRALRRWPGGRWLFGRLLALKVPYSASIHARVLALEPGYASVELPDRRRVRNHLQSVHAIALVNLAELATGLAVITALPSGVRGIVTAINITYLKKARGLLRAEGRCTLPTISEDSDYSIRTRIRDSDDVVVAEAEIIWRLGPVQ